MRCEKKGRDTATYLEKSRRVKDEFTTKRRGSKGEFFLLNLSLCGWRLVKRRFGICFSQALVGGSLREIGLGLGLGVGRLRGLDIGGVLRLELGVVLSLATRRRRRVGLVLLRWPRHWGSAHVHSETQ